MHSVDFILKEQSSLYSPIIIRLLLPWQYVESFTSIIFRFSHNESETAIIQTLYQLSKSICILGSIILHSFCNLIYPKNFTSHRVKIVICVCHLVLLLCFICGCGLMPLSGMVVISSSCVNTVLNCWFRIFALEWLSGAIKLLMYVISRLVCRNEVSIGLSQPKTLKEIVQVGHHSV